MTAVNNTYLLINSCATIAPVNCLTVDIKTMAESYSPALELTSSKSSFSAELGISDSRTVTLSGPLTRAVYKQEERQRGAGPS